MGTRIRRIVGAIVMVIVAGACAGASAPSAPPASVTASPSGGDLVGDIDIGGRTLSVACLGPVDTGRPTVIFETGLGGDRFVWADVFTALDGHRSRV